MPTQISQDQKYLDLIVKRIKVCKAYQPKFGQGKSVSLDEFKTLYGSDAFYAWFGLDNPLIYAAHKAAGGITSLYRQIGIGCEQLFRQIIQDKFGLTEAQATWSYVIKTPGRKDRKLSLDGRIQISDLRDDQHKATVNAWMENVTTTMGIDPTIAAALKGPVFEVRQGYKSKDSKRQNADIGNAGTAYAQGYLPVVVILSTQIDSDVADRYVGAGWLLLRGNKSNDTTTSTFAFCSQVLGYDLVTFFQTYSATLKTTVEEVVEALLAPNDSGLDPAERQQLEEQLGELEATDELGQTIDED